MQATFESVSDLIAAAVEDARGDAMMAVVRIRKALDADPEFRREVADALVNNAVQRIAEEIEGDYPMDPAITF